MGLYIFSQRIIKAGEELLYDYKMENVANDPGASWCSSNNQLRDTFFCEQERIVCFRGESALRMPCQLSEIMMINALQVMGKRQDNQRLVHFLDVRQTRTISQVCQFTTLEVLLNAGFQWLFSVMFSFFDSVIKLCSSLLSPAAVSCYLLKQELVCVLPP